MTRTTLRSRLRALTAIIRPYDSLAARIERLNPDIRKEYDAHRARSKEWFEQRETTSGGAYHAMLEGDDPPSTPRIVRDALFDPTPTIPETATIDEAAEIYRRFVDRR